MEPDHKRAIRYALREKRLWAAGLLAALTLSEAWWVVFGWGPEYLGERWKSALAGRMGDAGALAVFALAATAAFALLKALGYLGEMVLIRQVAEADEGGVPRFDDALPPSLERYVGFAATLLPLDAARVALVYLPALIIAVWERWDPGYDRIWLYILAILAWALLFFSAFILAGIVAAVGARLSLLARAGLPAAWCEAWAAFRGQPLRLILVWAKAAAADAAFIAAAWPLSALVPWAARLAAGSTASAPLKGLVYLAAYGLFAVTLIAGQTLVQSYKSSLWTITYMLLAREEKGREAGTSEEPARAPEPPPDFMPP